MPMGLENGEAAMDVENRPDPTTARHDVETVLSAWVQGLEALDADAVSSLFALDEEVANWGVSKGDRYVGSNSYGRHVKETGQVLRENHITVVEQQVGLSQSLDVAWFNQIRNYRGLLANGEEIRLDAVRVTGVLEKQDGKWAVVSFHHSVGLEVSLPKPGAEPDTATCGLPAEDLQLIRELETAHEEQILRGAFDEMAETLSEDVIMTLPGMAPLVGKAEIREFQSTFPPIAEAEYPVLDIVGCGDLAAVRASYSIADPFTASGFFVHVLRKQPDGMWRIIWDIGN